MGLKWPWGVHHGKAGVLVRTLLVVLCADIVDIGEGLVWVDGDKLGRPYARIREVGAKAGLEDSEDGVVRRIDGR